MIKAPLISYVAHFWIVIISTMYFESFSNLPTLAPWPSLGQLRQKPKTVTLIIHGQMRRRAETTNLVILPTTFLTPEKGVTFTRLTGLVVPRGTSSVGLKTSPATVQPTTATSSQKGVLHPTMSFTRTECILFSSYIKRKLSQRSLPPPHTCTFLCAMEKQGSYIEYIIHADFTSIYLSLHNPGILSPETTLSTRCRCIGRTFIGKDLLTNNHCYHYSEAS